MHGDIGPIVQECVLELLDEQALPSDLRERRVQKLVAPGGHGHELHAQVRVGAPQDLRHVLRLPEREGTLTGCDSQRFHRRHSH